MPSPLRPPTPARVTALLAAAQRDGWAPQIAPLRTAALHAYRIAPLGTADAWFHVYQWAALFGEPESEYVPRWIATVNAAKAGHANMPRTFPMRQTPLGAAVSPELQAWLVSDGAISTEFFGVISPLDYLPNVFATLNTLHATGADRFKAYANLALALAIVDDMPPPPNWPHGQVRPQTLPREFPPAGAAFVWWIRQDQAGHLYRPLKRMPVDELKFVVDAAAPFTELEWAQDFLPLTVAELPKAYTMIRYRQDRFANNQPVWAGTSYALADILRAGGICADQAYFASEVGKAHGDPTLLFHGEGNDARHAWFGFLDINGNWQLDAGRYAEQRFVTGLAFDPQTWREISDHELQFLRQHFRAQPSYRQSRVHAEFAADLLAGGEVDAAIGAARKAVQFEPRNQDGWETLIDATKRNGDAKATEVVMREAALAFQRFPDLEAYYVARVADSLRARGQTSEADEEIRRIVRKNQSTRVDISVREARDTVLRVMQTQPLEEQIRVYDRAIDTLGRGAGMALFDQVVALFVEHLAQLHHKPEAQRALEHARRVMAVQPNSQLENEFNKLQHTVDAMK